MRNFDLLTTLFPITDAGYFGKRGGKNHVRHIYGDISIIPLLFFILGTNCENMSKYKKGYICYLEEGVFITLRMITKYGEYPAVDINVVNNDITHIKSQKIHFLQEE